MQVMVGMEFGKLMNIYLHSANYGIHTNWMFPEAHGHQATRHLQMAK